MRAARLPHTPNAILGRAKGDRDRVHVGGLAEKAKNKLGEAKEAVSGVAGSVKEKVAAMGESATQTAEGLGRGAQDVYEQGRSTATEGWPQNRAWVSFNYGTGGERHGGVSSRRGSWVRCSWGP